MIYDYKIRRKNNEEILFLYFDFNNEFGKLKSKQKRKKIDKDIKDYIKKNNIKFSGNKIAIIAGGLLIGTILLSTPIKEKNNNYTNLVIPALIETIDQKSNEEVKDNIIKNIDEEVININTDIKTSDSIENTKKIETNSNINDSNNQKYVTVFRQSGTILEIKLEEYIIGVVGAEMPASFNDEALKAQAILARTYALKSINNNTRLTDTSSTQNYKNNDELKSMWGSSFNTYYQKIVNAVNQTKGMYLTYNGEIIEAVYHSTSNGMTEDAKNVWGNPFPYLISVESPYDTYNPSFLKEQFITYETLSSKLNVEINYDTNFNILSYTSGNRINQIEINEKLFTGVQVRNLLELRSTDFTITKEETGITFETKGYGHGVGMSQYGANGMAKNGYSYIQILSHYYPGTKINEV